MRNGNVLQFWKTTHGYNKYLCVSVAKSKEKKEDFLFSYFDILFEKKLKLK